MKGIKTAIAAGIISTFLIIPSFAKESLEKKVEYEVKCSIFHVGNGYYKVNENKEEYEIKIGGKPTGLFKFLGLEYEFSTKGYKKEGKLYPLQFKRLNKSPKTTEITDILYDYEKLEAKAYAYKKTQDEIMIKCDTRNNPEKITPEVKDFLTLIEELKRSEPKDYYEIRTVAKGKVRPFSIRKTGEETITLNDDTYETVVYETKVETQLFGIDSKAKIWINKEKDHTILKFWIENGPLWTSIKVQYSGKKSDLKNF